MEMGYYPGGMTGGNLAGIRGQGGRLCGDGVLSGGDDRWELGRDKGSGSETLWRWGIIRGG